MKYAPNIYAKALAEVIAAAKPAHETWETKIAKNFLALVRKNGDEAHLRRILEEAARLARGKDGVRKVTLETARTPARAQKESLVKSFLKPGDMVEEKI